MSAWSLVYGRFDADSERLREALCTLGNGYMATRGAAPEEEASETHYPGTYLAGIYNRATSVIEGRELTDESMVNAPNWLPLTFRHPGEAWFSVHHVEVLAFRQELDLRRGVLTRLLEFSDAAGRRSRLTQRRFVHMADHHLAGLETTITPLNWSGPVEVRSAIDGRVRNDGVARYRALRSEHLHVTDQRRVEPDLTMLVAETRQSRIRIAVAARTRVGRSDGGTLSAEPGYIATDHPASVDADNPLTIEKIVAVYTSRDQATPEPADAALRAAGRAASFDELLASNDLAWDSLWRRFDVAVEGNERAALVLRLHVFHLLATVSNNTVDLDAGVPARGLHGEAYRGHIFWDELFVYPLLNLRMPRLTRALLEYRYRRLPAARLAAQADGLEGAMFPWQSGSEGSEESPAWHLNPRSGRWIPDNSKLQRHVGLAIAYNAWQHYQVTADLDYLAFTGAELIIEIARFFSSLATYNKSLDRYEIRGVMGPDEYHDGYEDSAEPGLDNNTYTNVLVAWLMRRALEVIERLPPIRRDELWHRLGLRREELDRWDALSRKMLIVFHADGVILSQFEGYEELDEFDWAGYRARYGNIRRLDRILEAEGDTPNRYKVSKQADVLMLFYLFSGDALHDILDRLGYRFERDAVAKNIEYYEERTAHGSTLSAVVHSWVTARADRERSWRLFAEALESDIADVQGGTTAEGIHLGAMAGTIDLITRAYPGIETREDTLWFDPCLPRELSSLEFPLWYRGHWGLTVSITHESLRITLPPSDAAPITVNVAGEVAVLGGGDAREFTITPGCGEPSP